MNNYWNIPVEMRAYRQWIVWRYEETDGQKPTKVPYSIRGFHAAVDDPSTWASFDDAVNAIAGLGMDGLGFIFTDSDPFCGLDLDDTEGMTDEERAPVVERQNKIYNAFNSYSELSPSGKGCHIIGMATLPTGRRRSKIEIYSSKRFFTMTGNVVNNVPIRDVQGLAEILYNEMGAKVEIYHYDGDAIEKYTDEQVIAQALNATNGDKFEALLTGNWQNYYKSQSEADFAFIDILAFYTQNRKQLFRMFRASPLGARKKAWRDDYVNNMVSRSFDRQLPPLDLDGLYNSIEQQKAEQQAPAPQPVANVEPPEEIDIPRGLVGDIARFVYAASPRPVPEISIAAALGLMAGITGRSFNVSGTGLNLYTLLLAPTGVGKEAITNGINRLVSYVGRMGDGEGTTVPSIHKFIGPSEIQSGPALQKALSEQSCFVSMVGEFGLRMQTLASEHANSNDKLLKRMLLDVYHKSGRGQMLGKMAYSDTSKNVNTILSPAFSMLGESTPETFLEAVDERLIKDGLLPRFLVIEYNGLRQPLNTLAHQAVVNESLAEQLGRLVVQCHAIAGQGAVIDVAFEPEAWKWAHEFDQYCDGKINGTSQEVVRHLWNRAHLKLMKVAALIAVGANPINPVITTGDIAWSYKLINRDITRLIGRFERGETGKIEIADNVQQMKDMYKILLEFINRPYEDIRSYGVSKDAHMMKLISHSYISRRLSSMASFRKDRVGATLAIKRCIAEFMEHGVLSKLGPKQVSNVLSSAGTYYALLNANWSV